MNITLSKEHGVNPGLENCFFCNEPKGVILYGAIGMKKQEALKTAGLSVEPDGRAPNGLVMDLEPCAKCKGYMKQGVILISVRSTDDPEEQKNPYRTGGWVVVKDEYIKRAVTPKALVKELLKKRVAFIPDEAWDALGLPRGEQDEVATTRRAPEHDRRRVPRSSRKVRAKVR